MSVETEVMRVYRFKNDNGLSVIYEPFDAEIRIEQSTRVYANKGGKKPWFCLKRNGELRELPFTAAKKINITKYNSGIGSGVRAVYSDFYADGVKLDLSLDTLVWLDIIDGNLHFEIEVLQDSHDEVQSVVWPSPFAYDADEGDGYTVLPKMQGTLIPAKYPHEIPVFNENMMMTRDAYMPWFGQIKGGAGYMAVLETYYDAAYILEHVPKGDTQIAPKWLSSLGTYKYRRKVRYIFLEHCDYNDFCKVYRRYVKETGRFVSLKEKMIRNQNVEKLIGTPVFHTEAYYNIHEEASAFDREHPENNEKIVPFSKTEEDLRKFRDRNVERLYVHLDGWGKAGYDREHPDIFPPNEKCGGIDGMKKLADTCMDLGYTFGLHDQYRDYYHNARTYNDNQAIMNADGNVEGHSVWYGGPQSILCQQLAPYYVKRNYELLDKAGIRVQGTYLDVYSVVEMDECFHPLHRMTRLESETKRREALEYLQSKGIITSSEETVDCMLPAMDLCHHAPYPTTAMGQNGAGTVGIPVPLFSLVYHDAIITPWASPTTRKGGWGIPHDDWGYLYALLNGGTTYFSPHMSEEDLERGNILLALHKKVAVSEMLRHEFVGGNIRVQRTLFADGTVVEIDLEKNTYTIH